MTERPTPAVNAIAALVDGVPGWTPLDQLQALYTLALTTTDLAGDIVEVGAWCGRSSLALGLAARELGARVMSIDLFPARDDWHQNADGSWSFTVHSEGQAHPGYHQQTVWHEPFQRDIMPVYADEPSLLQRFLATTAARGFDDVIEPFRGTASQFVASRDRAFAARLAFLDGDHGYEAVCRDVDALVPRIVPGGWLCFDDAFSTYEGVDAAIRDRVIASDAYDVKRQLTRKLFVARRKRT